ncbi:unnamed protein product [Dovyalis caffra]|uniref:Pentatricopeptide repeat-containing protein n=1 Tax=Dovyalis caffra TaxID=77055 RepID=A0AAV1RQA3_9ROSI|nr:unnamed protein product [Dovyalis caffra]
MHVSIYRKACTVAVEVIKEAISIKTPGWKASTCTLASCLEGLKGQGDVEVAEELLNLVMKRCPLSPALYDKFKTIIRSGNLDARALDQMEGDDQALKFR